MRLLSISPYLLGMPDALPLRPIVVAIRKADHMQPYQMTKYTFHPEYVAPYYELLMNANFVNQPDRISGLFGTLHSTLIYCEHLIFALALLNTENSIVSIESHTQLETDALIKNFARLGYV